MDCTNCEKKTAAVPKLTSEQRTFLLALESKDARYQKLIRWIVSAFIFCMIMMSAIFIYAWTSYDYIGVDDGSDHMSQTIERMMQDKSGEEREVLEKCMDMIERYA